ncbi:hypothetical protein [Chryseobacterium sp. JV558]|nr:hypothetical protein [Chryseobacterium sp. JV558]
MVDFDSTIIKEQLTSSDLDSLRRNHIKISHGNFSTEKVPLVMK